MVDASIIREWLEKAEEDYGFVSHVISDEETFFAPLCFHCQQAAEKHLKAFLIAKGRPLRKIHSLKALLRECSEIDGDFGQLSTDSKELDPYYIDTRYPVSWPTGFSRQDAQKAFEAAGRIRELVKTKLSIQVPMIPSRI